MQQNKVRENYDPKMAEFWNHGLNPVTGWLPQKVLGLRWGFPEYYVDKSNNNQRKIR